MGMREAKITRFSGNRTVADGAEMLDAFEESFPLVLDEL
jgi:hypothetical protein